VGRGDVERSGGSGEVAEEFEGIDAVGVVVEPGLLGVAKRGKGACEVLAAYDTLDFGVVTG